jgi:flavin-dependent dehydrogenase
VEIDQARLFFQGRSINVHGLGEFVVYNRIELDEFLVKKARQRGLVIHENETVHSINPDSTHVEVVSTRKTYHAKVVVGADGSKGITRRLFNQEDSKGRVARAIETIRPARETETHFIDRFATFNFTPILQNLQGYYWDFPSLVAGEPRFNRGVYDSRFVSQREKAKLPAILEAEIKNFGEDGPSFEFQGHPIHWFSPDNRFSVPRLLLVGDAAGVDSLLGEGIGPALAYGKVAAETIVDAFRKKDFTFKDYKRRLMISQVGRYLLSRWGLAMLSYQFSTSPVYLHVIWTVTKILIALWPQTKPLYSKEHQPIELKFRD